MYSRKDLTKTTLATAVLLALGIGGAYSAVTDTGTTGNNFTMLGGTGGLTGGNNDTTFTWDGTLRTSVVTSGSNATLSSVTAFFGKTWTAKNVNVYGPGTYVFDTTSPVGTGIQCTANCNYTLTVPDGYLGAHMLFDWSTSTNIDVVNLWKISQPGDSTGSWVGSGGELGTGGASSDPFCAAPLTIGGCNTAPNPNGNTSSTVFSLISVDTPASTISKSAEPTEINLYHGTKMIDGPFVGQSANFSVNLDTTPNAFAFTDQTGVATSSTITSAPITIAKSGGTAVFPISVSGGTYSTDGGVTYVSTAGIVTTGQTVRVQHTSASTNGATTNTTVTIGGVSDTFTSTTIDTTPDAFSFTDQSGVALNSTITSNTITVGGINAPSPISVTGGTYSVDGGAYTSTAGTVVSGNTVTVRHTSPASAGVTNTTLTIGGVSDTFTSKTVGADTAPNSFSFTDQTNVALSSTITSNAITVSGINIPPAPISVSGGTYSVNGGAYTSTAGTVTNTDTVTVRHTSAGADNTSTDTTLTIGGVPDTFTSKTGDTTPIPFTFTDQTGVTLNSTITSAAITVTGIDAPAAISVSGGTYSINGGAYTSTAGTVSLNDTVTVRHTSSSANDTATDTTLTIGGVSDVFTSTTVAAAAVVAEVADPKMPGCSIANTTAVQPSGRAEWWLVGGFIALLGILRRRRV